MHIQSTSGAGSDVSGLTPRSDSATLSQESAQQFAMLMRAQMDSMMSASALGGMGAGGAGGGLQNLLMMQMLLPLTEALTRLSDRLDALDGRDPSDPGSVAAIPAPESVPYHDLMERLGGYYNVPAAFLASVMMAESAGDPRNIGDNGHSVGLFQLHDAGMGHGLGDLRFDPELNASIGARALADGWHEGLRRGLQGEELVRFAYDQRFNPGGGFAVQGDRVYSFYRFYSALAERA